MTMKAKQIHGRLYAQKTATFQLQFLADLVGFPTCGDIPILNDSYLSPVFGEKRPEKAAFTTPPRPSVASLGSGLGRRANKIKMICSLSIINDHHRH